nr:MAG TPA: hypothetical protein [Caudoviricetes sp.]
MSKSKIPLCYDLKKLICVNVSWSRVSKLP